MIMLVVVAIIWSTCAVFMIPVVVSINDSTEFVISAAGGGEASDAKTLLALIAPYFWACPPHINI